jgi:hypothetical protein
MFAEFGRECVDRDVATSSHLMSSLSLCFSTIKAHLVVSKLPWRLKPTEDVPV